MTEIRKPVARNFYPGDCAAQIREFLKDFEPPGGIPQKLTAAVLPHAGWSYSGRIAARTLETLFLHSDPERCIVFGSDHTGQNRHCLYAEGAWETPLGNLVIDAELGSWIFDRASDLLILDSSAHRYEHSIEVLCPMLKYFRPDIRIVPIIAGADDSAVLLGRRIGELLRELRSPVVLLASSDLTHYGADYGFAPEGTGPDAERWMRQNDRRMIDRLLRADAEGIVPEAFARRNACGPGALSALLAAVRESGIEMGYLVGYTSSHDQEPDTWFTSGVGYAGIVY